MRFPLLTSILQLFLRNPEFDDVLYCVNVYDVSILDKGDRPTDLGLRRDVTDAEPVRPMMIVSATTGAIYRLASCLRTGSGEDPSDERTAEGTVRSGGKNRMNDGGER